METLPEGVELGAGSCHRVLACAPPLDHHIPREVLADPTTEKLPLAVRFQAAVNPRHGDIHAFVSGVLPIPQTVALARVGERGVRE